MGPIGLYASLVVAVSVTWGAVLSLEEETSRGLSHQRTVSSRYETLQDVLPLVSFKCKHRIPGYYADPRFECEVFHYCHGDGSRVTIFCPKSKGTLKQHRICLLQDIVSKDCGQNEIYLALPDDDKFEKSKDTTLSSFNRTTDFRLRKVLLNPSESPEFKHVTTPLTPSQASRAQRISFRNLAEVRDSGESEIVTSSKDVQVSDRYAKTSSSVYNPFYIEAIEVKKASLSPASYSRGSGRETSKRVEFPNLEPIPRPSRNNIQFLKSVPPITSFREKEFEENEDSQDVAEAKNSFYIPKPRSQALTDKILYLLEVYNQSVKDVPSEDYSPFKRKAKTKPAVSSIFSETKSKLSSKAEPRKRRKRMVIKEVTARRPYAVFYAKVPDSGGPSERHIGHHSTDHSGDSHPPSQPQTIELSLNPSLVPLEVPTIPIAIRLPKQRKKQRKSSSHQNLKPQVIYDTDEGTHPHHSRSPGHRSESQDVSEQQNIFYYLPENEPSNGNQHRPSQNSPPRSNDPRVLVNANNGNTRQQSPQSSGAFRPSSNGNVNSDRPLQREPQIYSQPNIPGEQQSRAPQQPLGPQINTGNNFQQYPPSQFSQEPPSQPLYFGPPEFLQNGYPSFFSPFSTGNEFQNNPFQQGAPPAQQTPQNQNQRPLSTPNQRQPNISPGQRQNPNSQQPPNIQSQNQSPPQNVLNQPASFNFEPNGFQNPFFQGFPPLPDFPFPFFQPNPQSPAQFGLPPPQQALGPQAPPNSQANIVPQQRPPQPPHTLITPPPVQAPPRQASSLSGINNNVGLPSPNSGRVNANGLPGHRDAPPPDVYLSSYTPQQSSGRPYQGPPRQQDNRGPDQARIRPIERPQLPQPPPPERPQRPQSSPPQRPQLPQSSPPQRPQPPQSPPPQVSRPPRPYINNPETPSNYPPRPQPPSPSAPQRRPPNNVVLVEDPNRKPSASVRGTQNEVPQTLQRPSPPRVTSHQSYVTTSPRPYRAQNQQRPERPPSLDNINRLPPSSPSRPTQYEQFSTPPSRYRDTYSAQPNERPSNFVDAHGNRNFYNVPTSTQSRPTPPPSIYSYSNLQNSNQAVRENAQPHVTNSPHDERNRYFTREYVTAPPSRQEPKENLNVPPTTYRRPSVYVTTEPPRSLIDYSVANPDDRRYRGRPITDNQVNVVSVVDGHTPRPYEPPPRVQIAPVRSNSPDRSRSRYVTAYPSVETGFKPLSANQEGEGFYGTRAPVAVTTSYYTGENERRNRYPSTEKEESKRQRDGKEVRWNRHQAIPESDNRGRYILEGDNRNRYRDSSEDNRNRYSGNTEDSRNRYRDSTGSNRNRYRDSAELDNRNRYRDSTDTRNRYRDSGERDDRSRNRDSSNRQASSRERGGGIRHEETEDRRRYPDNTDIENRNRLRDSRERGDRSRYQNSDEINDITRNTNSREVITTHAPSTTPKATVKPKPPPPRPTFPSFPTFPPPPPPPKRRPSTTPENKVEITTEPSPKKDSDLVDPLAHTRKRLNSRPRVSDTDDAVGDDNEVTTTRPTRQRGRKRTRVRQRRPRPTSTEKPMDVDSQESASSFAGEQNSYRKQPKKSYKARQPTTATVSPVLTTESGKILSESLQTEDEFGNRIKLFGRARTRKPASISNSRVTTTISPKNDEDQTEKTGRNTSRRRPYKKRRFRPKTTTEADEYDTTEPIARRDDDTQSLLYRQSANVESVTATTTLEEITYAESSTEPYNDFITTTTEAKIVDPMTDQNNRVELARRRKPTTVRPRLLNFGKPRLRATTPADA